MTASSIDTAHTSPPLLQAYRHDVYSPGWNVIVNLKVW